MGIYVNLHRRIWNDDKFPFSSDDCQLVFFHLISTPLGTQFGLFKAGIAGLAEEKRWPYDRYRAAFNEAVSNGFVEYDEGALLVRINQFLKYNKPNNPNVLKSWGKQFNELPTSKLKDKTYQEFKALCESLGKSFLKAFEETFEKSFPEGVAKPYPKQLEYYSDSDSDSDSNSKEIVRVDVFDKDKDITSVKKAKLEEIENSSLSPAAQEFVKTIVDLWPEYEFAHAIDTYGSILPLTRKWKAGRPLKVLNEARARWPNERPVYFSGLNKLHPYLVRTFQNEPEEERAPAAGWDKKDKPDIRPKLAEMARRIQENELIDSNSFQVLVNTAIDDKIELPPSMKKFLDKLVEIKMVEFTGNSPNSGAKSRIFGMGWEGSYTREELYRGGPQYGTPEEVTKIIEDAKKKFGKP